MLYSTMLLVDILLSYAFQLTHINFMKSIKKFNLFAFFGIVLRFFMLGIGQQLSNLFLTFFIYSIICFLSLGSVFLFKKKGTPVPKQEKTDIYHYVATLAFLLIVLVSLSTFVNQAFGDCYRASFSSGASLWTATDICCPDLHYTATCIILPGLLLFLTLFDRRFVFGVAAVMFYLNNLAVNTAKVFGDYQYVAAAGTVQPAGITVNAYYQTVVIFTFVLVIAAFVFSVAETLIRKPKKVAGWVTVCVVLVVGILFSVMGFFVVQNDTTYDIDKIKQETFTETKEGSDHWLEENYDNAFGSFGDNCAVSGCNNNVVTSGDSNCCSVHSSTCHNCGCYVDRDAVYCMRCIRNALD